MVALHTEVDDGWSVSILREAFRNLQAMRSYVEDGGDDTLFWNDRYYSYWDFQRLYDYSQQVLPKRQKQAIRLCLFDNLKEEDAAVMMGVSPTNPVAMYATTGITKLLLLLRSNRVPGIRPDLALEDR